jgi:hypothetical protein
MPVVENVIQDLLHRIEFARSTSRDFQADEELYHYVVEVNGGLDAINTELVSSRNRMFTLTNFLSAYPNQRDLLLALREVIQRIDDLDKHFKLHIESLLFQLQSYRLYCKYSKERMRALYVFTNHALRTMNLEFSVIPTIGMFRYASLPLKPHNLAKYVLNIPFLDISTPGKWVLLTHEIGHIIWKSISEVIKEAVLSQLANRILRLSPDFETTITYYNLWRNYWFPELFADSVGVSLAGPTFLRQFVYETFTATPRSEWERRDPYHPPPEVRTKLHMRILENHTIWQNELQQIRDEWVSFSNQTIDQELSFPFDSEIVDFALESVTNLLGAVRAVGYWSEIIRLKEKLERTPEDAKGPLLVYAIALFDPEWECPETIYKAIAEE